MLLASGCAAQSQGSAFAWFRAGPAPSGWKTLEIPDGTAKLSVPPGAIPTESDPGSVSAEARSPDGGLVLYFNATPRQGDESLDAWPEFRLDHLTDENGQQPTQEFSRTRMGFLGGTGSCVSDTYTARDGQHEYREIACYVEGSRGGSVLVVATPLTLWSANESVLEQAVDSYMAE